MEFIFIFKGGDMKGTFPSEEEKNAYMGRWMEWFGGLTQKGVITGGKPLSETGKTVGKDGVSDFAPKHKDEWVGGYAFVNANSMEEAVEYAKGSPMLEVGGFVDVREIMEM